MKIIMMNKTCKNHKLLLVTELILCNNPKANGKSLLSFWRVNHSDANFGLAYKNTSSVQRSISSVGEATLKEAHLKSSWLASFLIFRWNMTTCSIATFSNRVPDAELYLGKVFPEGIIKTMWKPSPGCFPSPLWTPCDWRHSQCFPRCQNEVYGPR